ncbi:MAG: hypothetical protein AAFY08_15125 [Planctomycetota bacterium]
MSDRQKAIGLTTVIAIASLLLGVAGTLVGVSWRAGSSQQQIVALVEDTEDQERRIRRLEEVVGEVPYIRRDVERIRRLLEGEVTP